MKVNMGQIESGIIKYIDEEFVQKTDGLLKFAIVAAIELNAPKFENLMLKVSESSYIRALDLIDKDGLIELDPLKESLLKAIEKTGPIPQKLPGLGVVTFNEKDIHKIFECIEREVRTNA